ncbi:MAG TPA: pyridoxamine 5'-phosphate oxidase family protein [Pyrinomonadaceae bacterium]|nr:pyridoxamine 5'-phosphate oxidase family protein [Pyrinomonadaceae bacterium]
MKASAVTVLLVILLAPQTHGQQVRSDDALVSAAREIMTAARYCALITTDSAGRTHARAMDAFSPEADMKVWFGTNPRSRKVKEIRRNPKVTLYYFVPEDQAYVSITGTARLVNDPKEKANRFKDDWKAFYPDRVRDYLLIEVTPEKLELVSVKKGIVGDERAWQTPTVSFPRRKSHK